MEFQSNLKNSIIRNIESSDLLEQPFVHKFVENVFPENVYNELVKNIPSRSYYVPILDTGNVKKGYSPERYVFNLQETKLLNKLENRQKLFFNNLLEAIISNELFNSVTFGFSKIIDERLKNLSEAEKQKLGTSNYKFHMRAELVKDFTKYSIGVHTDAIHKLVSFLFYLPKDDSLKKIGTAIYEPINKAVVDNVSGQHFSKDSTNKYFKKIKTCPFIPNSVLIFPVTKYSYHGVEEINIQQRERNLLLLNYFFTITP